jgi:hypothetical protein
MEKLVQIRSENTRGENIEDRVYIVQRGPE